MERTMSVEDKIRRAEEIYARRKEGTLPKTTTVTVNTNNKKELKLLKKMIIQIIVSILIYLCIYAVQNNNYIFSEEFLEKTNKILSYDMNFKEIYQNLKNNFENKITEIKNNSIKNQNENQEQGIGGADSTEDANTTQTTENTDNTNPINVYTSNQEQSQEEKDIENIKATSTFIKPIEGTISSKYGQREPTTSTVPKNHTGVDIAANLGTKIKSATAGEVVIASEEGDYGKHLKIQIGEVSIIYAHCNTLYVKQGDQVSQGQEIAEVGTTGNSTGPHLHFEIRISERTIDPQKILEL